MSFSQLMQQGFSCNMNTEEKFLTKDDDFKVPIILEDRHFYVYPSGFEENINVDQTCVVMLVFNEKPLTVASYGSTSLRKASGGTTDYWEVFLDRMTVRRVHKRLRRYIFVPSQRVLPTGIELEQLLPKRRTVMYRDGMDNFDMEDQWESTSVREQMDNQEELWTGFTEFSSYTGRAFNGRA